MPIVIDPVADNEPIYTSWGNDVATEVNGNCVKKDSNNTINGTLTVQGNITANNQINITDAAVLPQHATRKADVDAAVAAAVDGRVSVTGDSMTGALLLPATQSTNGQAAVHKTYVDSTTVSSTGDSMSGALLLPATQSTNGQAAVHKNYVDAAVAAVLQPLLERIAALESRLP